RPGPRCPHPAAPGIAGSPPSGPAHWPIAPFGALAPGLGVVAPIEIAIRGRLERLGDGDGIFGHERQRCFRVDTAVGVRRPPPLVVHAKPFGILTEEISGQQLLHRMQLVLHLETQLSALLEEALASIRFYPADDSLGWILVMEGDGGQFRFLGPFWPVAQT